MTLDKFRKSKKFTFQQLANFIGLKNKTASSTCFRWCNGSRIPRKNMLDKIKDITKGKVKPKDFYEV